MKRIFAITLAIIAIAVGSAQLEELPEWVATLNSAQNSLLNRTFLKVHAWQWVGLALVAVIGLLLGLVTRWIIFRLTRLRDHFAPSPMSDSTRRSLGTAVGLLFGSLFANLLLTDLNLRPAFRTDLQDLLSTLGVIAGTLSIYAAWDVVCDAIASRSVGHERAERLLVPMTRKLVRALIVSAGILSAIALFGGTKAIATLIGTLGLGGIVVALAAKDSVENLFGSLTILFDMPFALGDWVKIDKVEGTVEEINLRSTRLRTAEDTVIHLPNANLIRASVENFGSRRSRRLKLDLRVNYECQPAEIDAFVEGIRQFLNAQEEVLQEKTEVILHDPQENTIGLLIDCRLEVTTYPEEVQSKHRILEEALRLRKQTGLSFGLNSQTKPA